MDYPVRRDPKVRLTEIQRARDAALATNIQELLEERGPTDINVVRESLTVASTSRFERVVKQLIEEGKIVRGAGGMKLSSDPRPLKTFDIYRFAMGMKQRGARA